MSFSLKTGARRKARELVLQALYQADVNGSHEVEAQLDTLCENFLISKKAMPYARELLEGISRNIQKIDSLITENAKNWRVDRMSIIDRNILRLGVFEVAFNEQVPATVAINEAIEIAKRFSADDSASFINGILDAVNYGQGKKQ